MNGERNPILHGAGAAVRDSRTAGRLDELLESTSRTFALTIPLLPEPTRGEVTVAYLLFRVADTLEDATRWPLEKKRAELARLAGLLRGPEGQGAKRLAARWIADPPCEHAGYLELLEELPLVVESLATLTPGAQHPIRLHIGRTIERMSGFVGRSDEGALRLRTLDELRGYCYAVAGIVGEMLTELFLLGRDGLRPVAPELSARAAAFGEALQLVNILKDASTDSREGRNYLPTDVERSRVFALAREDLATAGGYCTTLHEAGAPRGLVEFTTLPVLLARATLDGVERRGAGTKLTRLEVATIIQHMKQALDRDRFGDLWRPDRGV